MRICVQYIFCTDDDALVGVFVLQMKEMIYKNLTMKIMKEFRDQRAISMKLNNFPLFFRSSSSNI